MAELTKQEMLRIVDENISRLKNKDFNLYFFVLWYIIPTKRTLNSSKY